MAEPYGTVISNIKILNFKNTSVYLESLSKTLSKYAMPPSSK